MRVVFDSNAIINLCKSDTMTSQVIEYFESNPIGVIYMVETVKDEVNVDGMNTTQQANYERLMSTSAHDGQRYFTIGESSIGGSDVILGDGAGRIGIQRMVVDTQAAYKQWSDDRKAKGLNPKDSKTWLNRNVNQADAVIFERAEELGCDYVISDNKDILKAKNSSCRPIKLADFIALLK